MKALLDTNVFIRWMAGRPIPKPAQRIIDKHESKIFLSIVSAWEITMKQGLQRSAADVERAIDEMGAGLLQINFHHLDEFSRLPFHDDHRDPFDRMLIAQAVAEDIPIITSDTRFTDYKRVRVIWD